MDSFCGKCGIPGEDNDISSPKAAAAAAAAARRSFSQYGLLPKVSSPKALSSPRSAPSSPPDLPSPRSWSATSPRSPLVSTPASPLSPTAKPGVAPKASASGDACSSKRQCLCAPTTHAGSFRCRLHRASSSSSSTAKSWDKPDPTSPNASNPAATGTVEAQ